MPRALAPRGARIVGGSPRVKETVLSLLRHSLTHIDVTIRAFVPAYPIASIKAKAPRQPLAFSLGELIRDVLDMIWTAEAPMSVAELAAGLMRLKAIPHCRGAQAFVESQVEKSLQRKEGALSSGLRGSRSRRRSSPVHHRHINSRTGMGKIS